MKKTVLLAFLVIFSGHLFAQKFNSRTFGGLELGLKFEQFRQISADPSLQTPVFFYAPIYGVTVQRELHSRNFLLGTGLFINNYGAGFRFRDDGINQFRGLTSVQIPLRLIAKIPVSFGIPEVQIGLSLGTQVGFNTSFGGAETYQSIIGSNINSSYKVTVRNDLQKIFGLAEVGIFTHILLPNGSFLTLGADHSAGFSKLILMDISYQTSPSASVQTAQIASNGDYFSLRIGYQYPISRWWKKKN